MKNDIKPEMNSESQYREEPANNDFIDPMKQAGYLSLFHENPLKDSEKLPVPFLPDIFRIVPYPNYNLALGLMDDTAKMHLFLRIIGDPGCGKTRLLLDFKKNCEIEAHYVGVPKHSNDKDLLLMMSSAIGYYPSGNTCTLQQEIIAHINNQARPIVFLIDEIDNLCPKTSRGGVTNIDKLDVIRFIWDNTRRYSSFILAAPYDLEAMIQKSSENVSNSQIYRRCPAHTMTGMPQDHARLFLSYVEEDFNVILSDSIKSKLLSRINSIKRGGLGVAIDILFRAMKIEIPQMKEYYLALIDDIDRTEALKLFTHKEPIRISEEAILAGVSIHIPKSARNPSIHAGLRAESL